MAGNTPKTVSTETIILLVSVTAGAMGPMVSIVAALPRTCRHAMVAAGAGIAAGGAPSAAEVPAGVAALRGVYGSTGRPRPG